MRIGIVVPNLVQNRTAVEAEFLSAFCPNGRRVWQIPRFRVAERESLAQTPACAEVLSYLRVQHARRIVYSKAAQLVGSDLPEELLSPLAAVVRTRRRVDSSVSLPADPRPAAAAKRKPKDAQPAEDLKRKRPELGEWMRRFRKLIERSRESLDDSYVQAFPGKHDVEPCRYSLEDLSRMSGRPGPSAKEDRRRLLKILNSFREANGTIVTLEWKDEALLSRLEEAVGKSEDGRALGRLCEVTKRLEEFADSHGPELDFNEAYAYLRSGCSTERAPPAASTGPVEILSLNQAFGRHFTHLRILGMRDTEWPPRVHGTPLVQLSTLERYAPDLFQRDTSVAAAEAELGSLIHRCGRDNVTLSYAVRDARGDRSYVRAGSMESEDDEHGAADQEEPEPEQHGRVRLAADLFVKWGDGEREKEQAQHPTEPGDHGCVEYHVGIDEHVPLKKARDGKWRAGEFATQFECPFKAFAVHRLRIERPAEVFGTPYVAERAEEVRALCRFLDAPPEGREGMARKWRNYVEPVRIQPGIYAVTRGRRGGRSGTLLTSTWGWTEDAIQPT